MASYRIPKCSRAQFDNVELRPWQQRLLDKLRGEPHPKNVYWYCDRRGKTGKTWMTKYLMLKHGAFCTGNRKSEDVKRAYEQERIVVFDFSKAEGHRINYDIIETIKDGFYFSRKCKTKMIHFKTPHVVVFASFVPDPEVFSHDRMHLVEIAEYNPIPTENEW